LKKKNEGSPRRKKGDTPINRPDLLNIFGCTPKGWRKRGGWGTNYKTKPVDGITGQKKRTRKMTHRENIPQKPHEKQVWGPGKVSVTKK